jgi:thiamine-phosphate pyrophosphorylase
MLFRERGLYSYMITGEGDDSTLAARVSRALARGVDYVQVRRKKSGGREFERFVRRLLDENPGARRRILVNDRLDVALSAGAGGVHLPADGLPVEEVAAIAPPDFLVACSTHSRDEARQAERAGAAFVVFGPVFATASKPGHPGAGERALQDVVSALTIPVFALGGVSAARVGDVARAGAAGIAGISAFEREEDLAVLMKRLSEWREATNR